MSLIKDLQQVMGSSEDYDEKRLEITLYSDDEICIFVDEKRIPISIFPLTGEFYCDIEGYNFRLTLDDVVIMEEVMEFVAKHMDDFKEWLEEF